MPTIDLTDEELQGLTLVLANASGPGISWMLTNALLMKAQQAAAISGHAASGLEVRPPRGKRSQPDALDDMLDRHTALPQEH